MPKSKFASQDRYDVWFPNIAPSLPVLKLGRSSEIPAQWAVSNRRYRAEMAARSAKRDLALNAALSHSPDFPAGCCCEQENRCHRSVLRELFAEAGARFAP